MDDATADNTARPSLPAAPQQAATDRRGAMGVEWLHVDEALIVAVKPPGLPCVPARAAHLRDCLSDRVRAAFPDALVVHRLDMATSGLVLLARGAEAQRRLGHAFADRSIRKRYVAIVRGHLAVEPDEVLEIDLPLAPDWPRRPRQTIDPQRGKPSLSRAGTIAYDPSSDTTRLWLEPVTGRTHQLRVHLQAIGHPIVGDALYGGTVSAGDADADVQAMSHPSTRLRLHASEIRLAHPLTGSMLHFVSEPPF